MAKGTRITIDDLAWQILEIVKVDFLDKKLSSDALNEEYMGVSINALVERYCPVVGGYSKVDFDLALKQLENNELLATGPTVPYENTPNSNVVVLGFYSKREFVYLTEKGYKATKSSPAKRSLPAINVFSGNFNSSPIGVGSSVSQTIDYGNQENMYDLRKLVEVFEKHVDELTLDTAAIKKATVQVATIKAQLEDEPDPVIVKQAGRTLRNITEGAIGSMVATATQPTVWAWVGQAMQNLFG